MLNEFDLLYITLLTFFFWNGSRNGLIKASIGPACLAFWSVIGILSYDLNGNTISAVLLVITGSFVTSFILSIIFFIGKKSVREQHRNYVFWGSRLVGGSLSTLWNGFIIAVITIVISLMPNNFLGLSSAQAKIYKSISYRKFYTYLIQPLPAIKNTHMTIAVFKNHRLLEKYKDTPEYQSVFSDPRIKYITENPEIMKKMYSKNALTLLKDPTLRKILQDEDLMKKISTFGQMIFSGK